jgi:MFS family permease
VLSGGDEFVRGWTVLLACFLGVAFGVSSLYFYTIGIFLKPIAEEYGWSRTVLAEGTLASVVSLAAMAPLVGVLADRVSLRWFAVLSMLGLASGFWSMSHLPRSIGTYLGMTALVSIGSAGTTPVLFTRLVNQWFHRSRGLALGITLAGTGITGAIAPGLLADYVVVHGWRAGFLALAIAVLAAAPAVGLLIRERPPSERSPIANRSIAGSQDTSAAGAGVAFTDAVRMPRFWLLAAVFFCASLGVGSVMVHFVPMLTDAGLSPAAAGRTAGLIGLAVIVGRVASGALIDRISAPRIATALFAIAAAGCVALAGGGVRLAPAAAVMVGFAMGAEVDLIGYLVARYFGMRSYGTIYGCQYTAFLIGTALGPLAAATLFDAGGTYAPALYASAAALGLASLLSTRLPRIRRV